MNLNFPNLTITLKAQSLILESRPALRTLASAVVGGGQAETRFIIIRHVDKNYDQPDPAADLIDFARSNNIDEPFVGLMTAADLDRARAVMLSDKDLTVAAVVTAGLSNATSAGLSSPAKLRPGTINLVLLVKANLSPGAMVNAVITATEAKTDLLRRRQILTPDNHPATGTSTDAVVVACTGQGSALPYAGPATPVGWLIGQVVRRALNGALET